LILDFSTVCGACPEYFRGGTEFHLSEIRGPRSVLKIKPDELAIFRPVRLTPLFRFTFVTIKTTLPAPKGIGIGTGSRGDYWKTNSIMSFKVLFNPIPDILPRIFFQQGFSNQKTQLVNGESLFIIIQFNSQTVSTACVTP